MLGGVAMSLLRSIGYLFSRIFSIFGTSDYKGIRPGKIARGLNQEMNKLKKKEESGYSVPDEYVIFLSADDYYIIKADESEFTKDLITFIMQYAASKRYNPPGNLAIYFELDHDFDRGEYAVIGSYSESYGQATDKEQIEESPWSEPEDRERKKESSTIEYEAPKDKPLMKNQSTVRNKNDEDTIIASNEQMVATKLTVIEGPEEGKVFNINSDYLTLGRSRTCNIRLVDFTISRIHAYIKLTGEGYTITDFNSKNCTYINSEKVSEKKLESGDLIGLGRIIMKFEVIN